MLDVMTSGKLAALSIAILIGAIAAYVLLIRVPLVRNHPEAYVLAFALATAQAWSPATCTRLRPYTARSPRRSATAPASVRLRAPSLTRMDAT